MLACLRFVLFYFVSISFRLKYLYLKMFEMTTDRFKVKVHNSVSRVHVFDDVVLEIIEPVSKSTVLIDFFVGVFCKLAQCLG